MQSNDYLELITKEQNRRTFQRAMGRIIRSTKGKPNPKLTHLEQLGLAPDTCTKLRASGMNEQVLIKKIKEAGLL